VTVALGPCLLPKCDAAWLIDLEAQEAISFFVRRPGRHAGGMNFLCHSCLPKVIQLHAQQEARALLRTFQSKADGAGAVGTDQAKPPSHPTWGP
jgi:hypothetical protein